MSSFAPLDAFIARHPRLFIITGAGCSTNSGIPDYRDRDGRWKRPPPVTYQAFMGSALVRQRYWARSLIGWRSFGQALPNEAHRALARLEAQGRVTQLVTQNVDRLHQAAGSRNVIDLHGRLDRVRCMGCARLWKRAALQSELERLNPAWARLDAAQAPDGDAALEGAPFASFLVPPCPDCGGILKPDVVFYGETVPANRVQAALTHLAQADAMLIIGSTLMVYSGFRFALAASRAGKPIAAVNLGHTRADALLSFKLDAPCEQALAAALPPQQLSVARA
ncbi:MULTISPECIES: NAD-dependent protein deacetylase [unclassified Acidocella]|uniref:NAD-dependent protein deacetylase n=1 Tax=unclassified Acidocella TaxID=2648610 RepID=UPI00028F03F1|nr:MULTISPECIES: NAD-dependent protein deacetylase [unclassified Acidocella]EKM99939.1 NAD-dependent deacetylase [Acidocella sp. MX-AZ02]WBO59533.1 NAD-dependent protein deacetylase [Acidocella sp. MX-AZ03]